jgi:DNA invertase Pin-like site-specific DNA recombinase
MTCAVAYLRTSSATNVGADRDSDKRQRAAIRAYADRAGYDLRGEFYDAAVRGADRIEMRAHFVNMLAWCAEQDCRTIIVESASRFARDLIVQETGYQLLKAQGFDLIAADDPDAFTSDTPTQVLIRQVLGAVSQFEKANLVAKLKASRDRRSADAGRRIEGRRCDPQQIEAARRLADGRSLRRIAVAMASEGFLTGESTPLSATHVRRLLAQPA